MKRLTFLFSIIFFIILVLQSGCTFNDDENPVVSDPTVPHSPSPGNGATGLPTVVSLEWTAEGADKYDVYLSTDNPPTLRTVNHPSSQLTVVGLNFGRTYYWKVTAIFPDGSEADGPVWQFSTAPRGTTQDGFVMIKYAIETELPSFVNILFQVLNLEGQGVDNLTTADFLILENDRPPDTSEMNMKIRKREENPYTLKTILMLDNSTSLEGQIDSIRNAASVFIDNILDQQQVAIYEFSANTRELTNGFTSSKSELQSALSKYSLGAPSTNLFGAVIDGTEVMEDAITVEEITQSILVVFTDGRDTQGRYTLSDALEAIAGRRVYTVGLGPEISPDTLEVLGNAGFFTVNNVYDLQNKFEIIIEEIDRYANSFYWLNYSSPKEGNNNHNLKLYIKDNPFPSFIEGTFNSKDFYHPDRKGIYVNASVDNPMGITEANIPSGQSATFSVVTYLADLPPVYEWEDISVIFGNIEIERFQNDDSRARIKAIGASGQTATVKVTDTNNDLATVFTIHIK